MVFGFITTYAISVYHSNPLRRGVLDTSFFDKVCQLRWFSPGTPVSSTHKTDSHDIAEILLKVALNTVTLTLTLTKSYEITAGVNYAVYLYLVYVSEKRQIYLLKTPK